MKYLLQERMNKILMMIYENDIVPLDDIMTHFNISDRTIRNDVKELNAYLENYDAKIVLLRKKGYTIESKKSLDALYHDISQHEQHHLSIDSLDNRIFLIVCYLLGQKDYCSMSELCHIVYVSPSTMTSYLRTIKESLATYHLTLTSKNNVGYKIIGSEQTIRRYMFEHLIDKSDANYMTSFSPYEMTLFHHVDLEALYKLSLKYFPPETYSLSDYARKNFIIQTAIMLNRSIQDHSTDPVFNKKTTTTFANRALNKMLDELEIHYQIQLIPANKNWLLANNWSDLMPSRDPLSENNSLTSLVTTFLDKIKQQSQLDLSDDQLLINDLTNHFATYFPIKSRPSNKINPLMTVIKNKYTYAYEICNGAIQQLALFKQFKLNEYDIGYIALHIVASLERQKHSQTTFTKVVIVCSQGLSTSRLIEAKIQQHFSDSIKIMSSLSYAEFNAAPPENVDLIISTIPIKRSNTTVFYFDLLHVNKSIDLLAIQLEEQNQYHQVLTHLFDPSSFFHTTRPLTKHDAIFFLLKQVYPNFEKLSQLAQHIVTKEMNNPTNISPFIAIPHIMDDNIQTSRILTLVTNQPIKWDSQNSIKIVFLMLISPKDNDLLQCVMKWVAELLEQLPKQEQISYATSFVDFIDIIRE